MELWHGSEVVVEHPSLDRCRQFNDYGRGFYCTPHEENGDGMGMSDRV